MPPRLNNLTASIPTFGSNALAVEAGRTVTGGLQSIVDTLTGIGDNRQTQIEGDIARQEEAVRGTLDLAIASARSLDERREVAGTIRDSALSDADKAIRLNTVLPNIELQAGQTFDADNAARLQAGRDELARVDAANPVDPVFTFRNDQTVGGVANQYIRDNDVTSNGIRLTNRLSGGALTSTLQRILDSRGFGGNADVARYALHNSPIVGENNAFFSFDRGIDEDVLTNQVDDAIAQYQLQQRNRNRVVQQQTQFNNLQETVRLERTDFIAQQFM